MVHVAAKPAIETIRMIATADAMTETIEEKVVTMIVIEDEVVETIDEAAKTIAEAAAMHVAMMVAGETEKDHAMIDGAVMIAEKATGEIVIERVAVTIGEETDQMRRTGIADVLIAEVGVMIAETERMIERRRRRTIAVVGQAARRTGKEGTTPKALKEIKINARKIAKTKRRMIRDRDREVPKRTPKIARRRQTTIGQDLAVSERRIKINRKRTGQDLGVPGRRVRVQPKRKVVYAMKAREKIKVLSRRWNNMLRRTRIKKINSKRKHRKRNLNRQRSRQTTARKERNLRMTRTTPMTRATKKRIRKIPMIRKPLALTRKTRSQKRRLMKTTMMLSERRRRRKTMMDLNCPRKR
mmetsp:Transcript_42165/g.66841  ORF Transcript_42165/g.66841 Transcript_42165/m.66841 type:complete len:355 (+) Transcript_42165:1463-2527(+)